MIQQYGHQSAITFNDFGTNENKVNSFTVTYITKPKKPSKHNETQLLYVDTC
jgi:hypothetical protein